jgi:hypothetical protein
MFIDTNSKEYRSSEGAKHLAWLKRHIALVSELVNLSDDLDYKHLAALRPHRESI